MTLPSAARRSRVRTNAPPFPGLTCWNSRTLKTVPSTSLWLPFLNWFVLLLRAQSVEVGAPRSTIRQNAARRTGEGLAGGRAQARRRGGAAAHPQGRGTGSMDVRVAASHA